MDLIVSCTVYKQNSKLHLRSQAIILILNKSQPLNKLDGRFPRLQCVLYNRDVGRIRWAINLQLISFKSHIGNYNLFFENGDLLDKGGQSEGVYESFRSGEKQAYATKILRKTAELPLEIKLLNRFNHANIIKPRFYFQDEQNYYIVFEKLINLNCQKDEYQLQIQFKQILKAVQYIHQQGYIHRDIKPRNIMENKNQQVQLIDLGLVVKQSSFELRQSGTVGYTAPEIFRGPFYTEKVDMFILGAVFYELLLEKPLIDKDNKRLRNSQFRLKNYTFVGLSDLAQDLLMKLLVEDPNQRLDIQQSLDHAYFDQEDGAQISQRITPKFLSSLTGISFTPP